MRLATLRNLLWFCVILLVALAFPMQVYTKNPYPSLLPYFLIGLIVWLNSRTHRKCLSNEINSRRSGNIKLMVGIYLFLVLLNTAWQTAFGVIDPNEGASALVNFLLPVAFFWYFRKEASAQEIRSVLLAMVVAGVIVGIYFAYDSYTKIALRQVNDYAIEAFKYHIERSNENVDDANWHRIHPGYRSFGLLQSHSVSGAWVVLGALAALALLPAKRGGLRWAAILAFGTLLLLGLNFTSIVAFIIIMLIFEFGGLSALRGRLLDVITSFVVLVVTASILIAVAAWVAGDDMSEYMLKALSLQLDLALGTGSFDPNTGIHRSMGYLAIVYATDYMQNVFDLPHTLLLGDGFSSGYGLGKGGDIGLIESMARFGLPFFLALLIGFIGLIKTGIRQVAAMRYGWAARAEAGLERDGILQFAVCVTLLVLISEGHYSVWGAKAVLPIVFFGLALYCRYLSVPLSKSVAQRS